MANIIAEYCARFELLNWIPLHKLDRRKLSKNPNAIHLLEADQDTQNPQGFNIHWLFLDKNPSIFKLAKRRLDIT